ncbi:MAG: ABC-type transport auxiliary lipoprotein family protein [Pseudomonadota bacterium]
MKARKAILTGLVALAGLGLSGCVSLGGGGTAPESLLTLTPSTTAPVGSGANVAAKTDGEQMAGAIAVLTPEVPAKLDVLRVPVNVTPTKIAYLQDAFWVEKPARLFRRLLGESLRAKAGENSPLVLDTDDTPVRAGTFLRGTLSELSFDAETGSVVVRFDAIRSDALGNATTKRFEARESGITADAASVGPALNKAANTVASEVADWMMP